MKEQLKKQDMVVGKQYKGYAWRNEYGEFFFRPSDMVVGKQYKGYAWRNEYGEFFFRPSAVGSRAGQKMKICEENDYSLSTTKELVLVYIRIPRCQGGPTAYIKALTGVVNKLIAAFMRYEI